ncbi:hypothetical protein L6Q96_03060 [Candidatus Binatia bacterium]|nr:hypothetical protein [Candidatus Binatia bacterium]
MSKIRFLAVFLSVFAVLLVVWRLTPLAQWYTDAMIAVGSIAGPALHGWVLRPPSQPGGAPSWVRGGDRVDLAIQFDALAVGVVPLLALLAATPGLGARRRAILMGVACIINVLIDGLIVALFPLLVYYKNAFTDVIGTFLGIVAFVGAPVIIWFALTFRELKPMLPSLRPRVRATS